MKVNVAIVLYIIFGKPNGLVRRGIRRRLKQQCYVLKIHQISILLKLGELSFMKPTIFTDMIIYSSVVDLRIFLTGSSKYL